MKLSRGEGQRRRQKAFGLKELIALLVFLFLLIALVIFPFLRRSADRSERIGCVSRLKNIGLGFRIWATDNGDLYPFHNSTNGTSQLTNAAYVFRHFQILSNELSTGYIVKCPADVQRTVSDSFKDLSNSNISYFVGISANEHEPLSLLAGDRNIVIDGTTAGPGRHKILNGSTMSWTDEMHRRKGNIALGDGSVQQHSTVTFNPTFGSRSGTNVILVP